MKSLYRFILLAVVIASMSACSVTRHKPYSVNSTRLNLTMADLEYVGETEISVDYRTYLGFISVIDTINEVPYDGVEIRSVKFKKIPGKLYSRLKRASYKVVEQFPDADYFLVVSQEKSATNLFLGSEVSVKAKIKAYKLK